MKKSIFALLMVLVLIAAAVIIAVPEASAEEAHKHCVCGGKAEGVGNHTQCEDIEWTAWTDEEKLPTATGNYYLTVDVVVDVMQQSVSGATVSICLNGHKVTGYTTIYKPMGSALLNICDCSAQNQGAMIANVSEYDSSLFGTIISMSNSKNLRGLNLYSGTLMGGPELVNQKFGLIGCNKNIPINIYAAVITGGKAELGGNISLNGIGTLNMYGGEISNGVAQAYDAEATCYSVSTARGLGGNIYAAANSGTVRLNLYGGVIKGGKAYYANDKVETGMKDDGVTPKNPDGDSSKVWSGMGGNVYVGLASINSTKAPVMYLMGTQIQDGSANGTVGGNNIALHQSTLVVKDADFAEGSVAELVKPTNKLGDARANILELAVSGVKLRPGKQAIGFTVQAEGATFDEYGVKLTIEGNETSLTKAFTANDANTVWMENLLAGNASGAEEITVQVYVKIGDIEYVSEIYTTNLKAVIEKAEGKADLTEAQIDALQALKAQIGQ